MSESFKELFEESAQTESMSPGTVLQGCVVGIKPDYVVVNVGLKSEGVIPIAQFYNEERKLEVTVGDEVDVVLDAVDDGFGETRLSREKAKRAEAWTELEAACEKNETVKGMVIGKVKGGFTVEVRGIRAFLPGSLVDVRPVRDSVILDSGLIDFKVIKLDQKRNNAVVSRRAVIEAEGSAERDAVLQGLQEGQEIKGIVKNLTDYGAFVDLGGIDGLLHITDMAWKRVKHPSEVVNMGDEITVKILKFDKERSRVSLGLKQLGGDPWQDIERRYPENSRLSGKVTNITDYGFFVEIEEGIEGLVHVSEIDWTNKNIHPSKVVQVGDEVNVMVLEIDEERRRISLGMKQCVANPWETFGESHEKGDKVKGAIKSITDFGVFIGLDGAIDGLIHLSDISWSEPGEVAVRNFKRGEELEAVILSIDPERERISLGLKQLESDPVGDYLEANEKGAMVKGKIIELDTKGMMFELAEHVHGYMRASDISRKRVDDPRKHFKVGDELEVKNMGVDRKSRAISLSLKAVEHDEERAVKDYTRKSQEDANSNNTTLGDLFKAQVGNKEDES